MKFKAALIGLLLVVLPTFAQRGTAPSGYYPVGFFGDTFTGQPTATVGNEVTLTYRNGTKTENFVGVVETGCSVPRRDGSKLKMMASDFHSDSQIIAFYQRRTVKTGNQNQKINVIFAIAFSEVGGQKIREEDSLIYYCTKEPLVFKAL